MKRKVEQILAGRFNEEDFIDRRYSRAEVEADLKFVRDKEAQTARTQTREEREAKELADVFEAMVLIGVKKAGWLGLGAGAFKTSKFDDAWNNVDMLVEFKERGSASYLGLAADVTFSSRRDVVAEKFASIRDKIKKGVLSQIKYFHSEHTGYDGELSKQPEVVIGVSKRMVEELAQLLAAGNISALASHPTVGMILRQIEAQLDTFQKYALSMHNRQEAARIYGERLRLIREIMAEKGLAGKVESARETDPVHQEIMKFVQNWSRY